MTTFFSYYKEDLEIMFFGNDRRTVIDNQIVPCSTSKIELIGNHTLCSSCGDVGDILYILKGVNNNLRIKKAESFASNSNIIYEPSTKEIINEICECLVKIKTKTKREIEAIFLVSGFDINDKKVYCYAITSNGVPLDFSKSYFSDGSGGQFCLGQLISMFESSRKLDEYGVFLELHKMMEQVSKLDSSTSGCDIYSINKTGMIKKFKLDRTEKVKKLKQLLEEIEEIDKEKIKKK